MKQQYDVCIIGAGIVGLATAYSLRNQNPSLKILVLEKETEVAAHQTSHNSGVIHSGIYYKPQSLKALNCTRGYDLLLKFCELENLNYDLCGKIIVATKQEELPRLEELYKRSIANNLKGVRKIQKEEIKEFEPHCSGLEALHVPQTGIIDYKKVSQAILKNILSKDVQVEFQTKVLSFNDVQGAVEVVTSKGNYQAKLFVNCAGLYCDEIAEQEGRKKIDVRIIPFRGEYYELKPTCTHLVRNLIYPVPNPAFPFLGVHFTRMIAGGVELGPNAVLAFKKEGYKKTDFNLKDLGRTLTWPGFYKIVSKYWKDGAYEMYRSLSKRAFLIAAQELIPSLTLEDMVPGGSGVRAQACSRQGSLLDDFSIIEKEKFIHVMNAPSPAATSSFAIGESIAGLVSRRTNFSAGKKSVSISNGVSL